MERYGSHTYVLAEQGDYRALIVADDTGTPPYSYSSSPILRYVDRYGTNVEQVGELGDYVVPSSIIRAAETFERDVFERYLRIFHGATSVVFWHGDRSSAHWFVTFDTAEWREQFEVTPVEGHPLADMSEWQAYVKGEVYGVIIEHREPRTADRDDLDAVREGADAAITYDEVVKLAEQVNADNDDTRVWTESDAVWGFYGTDYAEQTGREMLAAHVTEKA